MTTRYLHRKKKVQVLSRRMKIIRIDARTEIEVSASLSNEEAIERYYKRHTSVIRPSEAVLHPLTKDECFEVMEKEDLKTTIVFDDELPEEE